MPLRHDSLTINVIKERTRSFSTEDEEKPTQFIRHNFTISRTTRLERIAIIEIPQDCRLEHFSRDYNDGSTFYPRRLLE